MAIYIDNDSPLCLQRFWQHKFSCQCSKPFIFCVKSDFILRERKISERAQRENDKFYLKILI
jgi:hypothetical protein